MKVWEWLKKRISSDDKEEHVETEAKLHEAQLAVQASDDQLSKAKEVRQESDQVGATARWLQRENHFAQRLRQALEGR